MQAGEGFANAALSCKSGRGRRARPLLLTLVGEGARGRGGRDRLGLSCACLRPGGQVAQAMGQKRARVNDLVWPGSAACAHVVVEGAHQRRPGPGRQVEMAALQGVAELADNVLARANTESCRGGGEPSRKALGVQGARVAASRRARPLAAFFGGEIAWRGAVRLAWRC